MPPAGDRNNASRAKTDGADYPYHWGQGTNRHLDTIIQPLGNNGEVHPKGTANSSWKAKRQEISEAQKRRFAPYRPYSLAKLIKFERRSEASSLAEGAFRARQCFLAGLRECLRRGVRKDLKRCCIWVDRYRYIHLSIRICFFSYQSYRNVPPLIIHRALPIAGSAMDGRRSIVPAYLKGTPLSWFHLGESSTGVVIR